MSGIAVLVVEDERLVAIDLQQTLLHMGYDAYAVAASADEALSRAAERRPDIVLMDIRIKGTRDGVETAALLRGAHDVPIIYVTAHADDATLARAKETDPQGYVVKPVKAAELRSTIELSLHRHAIDARLRRHDRWLSTTLGAIVDGVVSVDARGLVTFLNPAAEALLGVGMREAVGRTSAEITASSPPTPLDAALAQRVAVEHEDVIEHRDGRRIVEDRAAPVLDGTELLGAVMVVRDVTEQRQMMRQLELADRLVSLGTLAAGVAHEVRNPLAVVLAGAELAKDELVVALGALRASEPAPERVQRALEEALDAHAEIVEAAQQIRRIVSDLRVFGMAPESSSGPCDVARALGWAVRTTGAELRERATVVVDTEPGLIAAIDDTRLGQVLVNLLINATHAIEPGRPDANRVTVGARRSGGRVVIMVADTGRGMSPEVKARMLEPFFTTRASGSGTGLGLAITHTILSAAGGSIEADSTVGVGTTFRVSVPAAAALSETSALPSPQPGAAGRACVLVVDDDPVVQRILMRALRAEHDVVCASSAEEALEQLDAGARFDLVVSDLTMPGMGGTGLLQALAARHPEMRSRVLMLSGRARSADDAALLDGTPYLAKPFKLEELRDAVRLALRR